MILAKTLPFKLPLSTMPDVTNTPYINKVVYGDRVLLDLTNDTVTENDVLKGVTFHKADGSLSEGGYEPLDLSSDTVTANFLLSGYTAHDKNKNIITGTFSPIVALVPSGNDAKWKWELYSSSGTYPTVATLNTKTPSQTRYYADSSTSISMNISDSYSAKCTIYGYLEADTTASLLFSTDDGGTLTVNDVQLGTCVSCKTATYSADLKKGWNKIEVCYTEGSGGDGWYCNYNSKRIAVSGLFTAITSTLEPAVINMPNKEIILNYAY